AKAAPSPPPAPNRMPLTPAMGVPAPASGTPQMSYPLSATPSLGSVDPRRAAPSFGEASPAVWVETRRTSYWTLAMYILGRSAGILAVAAAWVSMSPDPSRPAIRPMNQQPAQKAAAKAPIPVAPPPSPPPKLVEAPPPPVERSPEPPPPEPPPPVAEKE